MEINNTQVFTLDPDRFPLEKMQELVTYLHDHDQHYIMMVDPAVAYQNYTAFENGESAGIFLMNGDGSIYQGEHFPLIPFSQRTRKLMSHNRRRLAGYHRLPGLVQPRHPRLLERPILQLLRSNKRR